MNFTKRKFLAFPIEQQHKKSAEILRKIYDSLILNSSYENEAVYYNLIQEWMKSDLLLNFDKKTISDRYHRHLKLANVAFKEHNLLPQIRVGDKFKAQEKWPIEIYLDQLRSAHNVGSILRTVEAFSLGEVFFSKDTPFIDHKQVQNSSMGSFEWVTCHRNASIENLKRPVIVMETAENALSLHQFVFPEEFTLALGNEEYGCRDETLKNADYIIEIPLRGRKNSLNVSNAFAIAAAEIQRQKEFVL
jgi:tRNA G18 (ribose-2'-O)-methylase SpoU